MLRVLLFDDGSSKLGALREAVVAAGCEVVGEVTSPWALPDTVARLRPDAVLMDVDSPSRDVLEQVCVTSRDEPRPIVVFTADGSDSSIEAALAAGVSAYIVDGIDPERIHGILRVAMARFRVDRTMRDRLDAAQQRFDERKLVDRAKALVMKHEKLDENDAYHAMRKAAMARGVKLADIAREIIRIAGNA